jgi:hypothetical protein
MDGNKEIRQSKSFGISQRWKSISGTTSNSRTYAISSILIRSVPDGYDRIAPQTVCFENWDIQIDYDESGNDLFFLNWLFDH